MLAWLNMGIIPPHLKVVTYKVAVRGGRCGCILFCLAGCLIKNRWAAGLGIFGEIFPEFWAVELDFGGCRPWFLGRSSLLLGGPLLILGGQLSKLWSVSKFLGRSTHQALGGLSDFLGALTHQALGGLSDFLGALTHQVLGGLPAKLWAVF